MREPKTRFIAMFCHGTNGISESTSKIVSMLSMANVEVYLIDTTKKTVLNDVDMALMNDLICPIDVVFVGGEDAKKLSSEFYGTTWIKYSPGFEDRLIQHWGLNISDAP